MEKVALRSLLEAFNWNYKIQFGIVEKEDFFALFSIFIEARLRNIFGIWKFNEVNLFTESAHCFGFHNLLLALNGIIVSITFNSLHMWE